MKIVEGTVANVPPQGGRKHPQQEFIQIDTTNILFICGGALLKGWIKLSKPEKIQKPLVSMQKSVHRANIMWENF